MKNLLILSLIFLPLTGLAATVELECIEQPQSGPTGFDISFVDAQDMEEAVVITFDDARGFDHGCYSEIVEGNLTLNSRVQDDYCTYASKEVDDPNVVYTCFKSGK